MITFAPLFKNKGRRNLFNINMSRHRNLFFILLFVFSSVLHAEYYDHRNRHVDSLENVLQSSTRLADEELMRAYDALMWGYLQVDGEKSKQYAQAALDLARRHPDWISSECGALRILGMLAYGVDDYDTALDYYNQSLEAAERMQSSGKYKESEVDDALSSIYGSIGNLYNMQDKLQLAISYYQKALPIFEKYNWKESTAILYYNVAELYSSIGNTEKAKENYDKSLKTAIETEDPNIIALANKGLGMFFCSSNDFDNALPYLEKAYSYYSSDKDLENDAYVEILTGLGRIRYHKNNDLRGALQLASEARSRLTEDTGSERVAGVYNLCCELCMLQKRWKKALEYAEMAINADSAETFNDLGTMVWMTQIYNELGEREKANEMTMRIYNGMSEFATAHYQQGISEMEVRYDTEKKQAAIEQLEKERKSMILFMVLIGLLILILIIVFVLVTRSMRQQRQIAVVQAQLQGEIAERVRISRDLHDRLGGLLTLLKMQLERGSKATELADDAIREMRNISHHLLPDSLKRNGLVTALREYCATMPKVVFTQRGEYHRLEKEDVMYCIMYELINNAVKHAEANKIIVDMLQDEDMLTLKVSDDGKGFNPDVVTTGTGLKNVRERVASLNGNILILSNDKGTEVIIEVPVK